MEKIDLSKFSIGDKLGFIMSSQTTQAYGMRSLSIFRKEINPKVKSMAIKLDSNIHSGIIIEINPDWLDYWFVHNPKVIEAACRFMVYRIVARHFVDMLKTSVYGEPGWEAISSLGSQIAAADLTRKNTEPEWSKELNVLPENLDFPADQPFDEYIRLILRKEQEQDGASDGDGDVEGDSEGDGSGSSFAQQHLESQSGIGPEDFSGAADSAGQDGTPDATSMLSKMEITTGRISMELNKMKQRGDLPADLQQLIDANLKPRHDLHWTRLLEQQVSNGVQAGLVRDRSKLNRRQLAMIATGIEIDDMCVKPGFSPGLGPCVGVFMDESGSINNEEYIDALETIMGVVEGVNGARLFVIPFDVVPGEPYEVTDISDVQPVRQKCGGTDISIPMLWAFGDKTLEKEMAKRGLPPFEYKEDLSTVIVITDGYGPAPAKHQVPSNLLYIWLLACSTNSQVPYTESRSGKVDYGWAIWRHDGRMENLGRTS